MNNRQQCPICRPNYSGTALVEGLGDALRFNCNVCGVFVASNTVLKSVLGSAENLTIVQRAILSHRIRIESDAGRVAEIDTNSISDIIEGASLPSVSLQAKRLIESIGNQINKTGLEIAMRDGEFVRAGCLNSALGQQLVRDLVGSGEIVAGGNIDYIDEITSSNILTKGYALSLSGWEEFEFLKSGKFSGNYAFIAMKFNDEILDPFISTNVKEAVKDALGFQVVDLRDVSQAGIIDNLMRAQIRDSAFVLVDLSHDNSGAYWEAGYAEGLGKPVIYLCEKNKFEEKQTHFDTNHCTTVVWEESNPESFKAELIATVRRSIGYLEGRS